MLYSQYTQQWKVKLFPTLICSILKYLNTKTKPQPLHYQKVFLSQLFCSSASGKTIIYKDMQIICGLQIREITTEKLRLLLVSSFLSSKLQVLISCYKALRGRRSVTISWEVCQQKPTSSFDKLQKYSLHKQIANWHYETSSLCSFAMIPLSFAWFGLLWWNQSLSQ